MRRGVRPQFLYDLGKLVLRLKGYRIEARNWRCRLGEIDIVAWDRDTLVFVEVKMRTGRSAGAPAEAVTVAKQRRIVRLAQSDLTHRRGEVPPCRFDVIAVAGRNGGSAGRLRPRSLCVLIRQTARGRDVP